MIKNIIFDMGNVLLDYNPQICLDCFLENEKDKALIMEELFRGPEWIEGDLGYLTDEERYDQVKKRIPERLHGALKNCAIQWTMCMKPIEGAKSFCDYAKAEGYRLYVLSNASKSFYEYFPREFAPLSYFDGIVVSCDIHKIKPDRRIYEYLLGKYRLIPAECFFLDDMQENVDGAKETGMSGMVFTGDYLNVRKMFTKTAGIEREHLK